MQSSTTAWILPFCRFGNSDEKNGHFNGVRQRESETKRDGWMSQNNTTQICVCVFEWVGDTHLSFKMNKAPSWTRTVEAKTARTSSLSNLEETHTQSLWLWDRAGTIPFSIGASRLPLRRPPHRFCFSGFWLRLKPNWWNHLGHTPAQKDHITRLEQCPTLMRSTPMFSSGDGDALLVLFNHVLLTMCSWSHKHHQF